ncbi:LysR family transcriptional regulator [Streptomyces sp. NBC_00154]|uniref:LysR family transcriptional regulator n=1 Tax=Streptomyces sp. NBC_00154 TaxID=2975670 RepID=UPI00225A88B8|nr:LysR family transcriptional regulator [Streptomyces sp. NBC_00154]MCX5316094.1 LysR family transcriptional regulator [Streptomyces sp. NBC_00154]
MLDVKRMVMLRDLAQHGRVGSVADLHGVTSSAVSQQLRTLESEAGAPLVHREGRTLRLTAAGAALAAECEHVLAALERAEGAVRALDDDLSGELKIGCAPSAISAVAAPLVAELVARHPRLRPMIVQSEPEDAVPLLRQQGLDLAVSYRYHLLGTPPPSGTIAVPLFDDPLVVAVPDKLVASVREDGLGVLRDLAWISAPEPSTCREILVHACRNAGFTPRIEHSCVDLRSALSIVATGHAVTVLPNLLCDSPPPGTAVLPLPGRGRVIEALVRAGSERQPALAAALAVLTGGPAGER